MVKFVFASFQLSPLSVETKTPFVVPANVLAPITANTLTPVIGNVKPLLAVVHVVPLSVDRKRYEPKLVPAKRYEPFAITESTLVLFRPELTAFQLLPLFVERYAPLPEVPAKIFVPLTPREITELCVVVDGKPAPTAFHVEPLSEE